MPVIVPRRRVTLAMSEPVAERSTLRATTRVLDEGKDFVAIAALLATLGQHWDVIGPLVAALQNGDRVEIEEAAPVRVRGEGRRRKNGRPTTTGR
jgi:hypothetical protein